MAKTKVREILNSDDSKKEKLGYLWGYYRIHLIILILGIALGIYFVVDWMNRPITYFHVTVLAPEVDFEEEEDFTVELNNLLDPEGENETAFASFTPHGQLAERFVAQLSAAEYDVILMDEGGYEQYADFGTMQTYRIEEMDEEDYYQPEIYDDPIGVDAGELSIFDSYRTTDDLILLIPENSQRKDITAEFFETQGYTIEFID